MTQSSTNTKTLATMIEILGGWAGFLGVGHFIMGNWLLGLVLLVGWWIALIVLIGILIGTFGSGFICVAPIWFLVPIVSGFSIR